MSGSEINRFHACLCVIDSLPLLAGMDNDLPHSHSQNRRPRGRSSSGNWRASAGPFPYEGHTMIWKVKYIWLIKRRTLVFLEQSKCNLTQVFLRAHRACGGCKHELEYGTFGF